jgi:hypothetical protein
VAADVEKCADAFAVFANDDNLFITDPVQEIITFFRDARHMASQQPFPADDLIKVGFENRIAGVEFLIETVSNLRVRSEAAHKFIV